MVRIDLFWGGGSSADNYNSIFTISEHEWLRLKGDSDRLRKELETLKTENTMLSNALRASRGALLQMQSENRVGGTLYFVYKLAFLFRLKFFSNIAKGAFKETGEPHDGRL
jgi:hypothetical protein